MNSSAPTESSARPRLLLIALGLLGAVLYAGVLGLSFRFELGLPEAARPILEVLGLLAAATIVWWLSLGVVLHLAPGPADVSLTRIIFAFAVLYRLILLFAEPIQEIDFYRYLWDGRVLAAGHNPFRHSKQQIEALGEDQPAGSELHELWLLSRRSPAVATIFQRVHHPEVPTVYPPAAQAVFVATALVVPAAAPWWLHVLALKVVLVAFDLATISVLIALLRTLGKPTSWCLAYAWCPLAVKEFANSAHLDSIAVLLTTLAVYHVVRVLQGAGGLPRACLATVCLALAILAKSFPVVLLLLVAAALFARLRFRAILPLALAPLVVVAGYLPFSGQPAGDLPDDEGAFISARPYHPGTGLRTFLGIWEMNDFIVMVVSENLRWDEREQADGPDARPPRWFVIVPAGLRESIKRAGESFLIRRNLAGVVKDPAFGLTQLIMAGLVLSLCLVGAIAVYRRPEPVVLLRWVFLTLFWGWMLSSTQNPWYLLWGLPFMVFACKRAYFLMPGLVLLYYVRFWLEYQAPSAADVTAAWNFFDFTLVWFEYVPFLIALAVELVLARRSCNVDRDSVAEPAAERRATL